MPVGGPLRAAVRAAGLAATAFIGSAAAQVDPGAPEGARQTARAEREFDSYDLPIGPFGLDQQAVRPVEGAVSWSAWRLDDPQASVAGVMQGYRERLDALGFEPVFACEGEACGGFDFRFAAEILPPPGMLVDVRDFAQLTAERDEPAEAVSVLVSRVLDTIWVQTVSVAPAEGDTETPVEPAPGSPDAPDAPDAQGMPDEATVGVTEVPSAETAPASAPGTSLDAAPDTAPGSAPDTLLDEAPDTAPGSAPETALLPEDERATLARLMADGHVPVQGIDFEVGGAELSEGSAEALDRLARMLSGDEGPAVAIVGHSDNQGGLALNLALSQRRAEAVMRALIDRGVPPDRLEARGIGYLAPVASNATEEGRARNRRVELVLR
jgi:outer membrane protein OmpA-like peptidoglycan-associated protein